MLISLVLWACQILAYERDNGTVFMNGSEWNPFQPSNARTPPFPSFTSGHSTFGGAFEAVSVGP